MKHILFLLLFIATSANAAVTNSFTASRITGVAPLGVFFDASATTSTATTEPYHELNYAWNFDDTGAGDWTEGNANNVDKNSGYGPTNAHVFENAGTYTVELTTTDSTGATDVDTIVITVTDPDAVYSGTNTVCFSTSGTFTDCPLGAEQVTTSSFQVVGTHKGAGKRLLLRAGETWTSSARLTFSNTGPGTLSSFGTGAKPTITNTHTKEVIRMGAGAEDQRFFNLNFSSLAPSIYIFEVYTGAKNMLVMDTTNIINKFGNAVHVHYSLMVATNTPLPQNIFIHDNVWNGFGNFGAQLLWVAGYNISIQGNNLQDTETNSGEHLIRIPHIQNLIMAHNLLSEPASPVKGVVTIRSANINEPDCDWCSEGSKNIVVADNDFYATSDNTLSLIGENGGGQIAVGVDAIIERNFFTQHASYPNEVQMAVDTRNITGITIRNNTVLMDNWASYRGISIAKLTYDSWVYNNSCYTSDSTTSEVRCVDEANTSNDIGPIKASNNLIYAPNATGLVTAVAPSVDNTGSNNVTATSNPFMTTNIDGPEDFTITQDGEATNTGTNAPAFLDYTGKSRTGVMDAGAYADGDTTMPPPIEPPIDPPIEPEPCTCTGEQGIQGEQGVKGDQGIQGVPGEQGIQGAQGIQGGPADVTPEMQEVLDFYEYLKAYFQP